MNLARLENRRLRFGKPPVAFRHAAGGAFFSYFASRRDRTVSGLDSRYRTTVVLVKQISVIIDSPPEAKYHVATISALEHAVAALGQDIPITVVRTPDVDDAFLSSLDGGVVIGPGSPYDVPDRADAVIRSARERGVPLVGT